jgi:hypothetical protein
MLGRSVNVVEEKDERRIRKNMPLRKIGMISTIQLDQIVMKSTSIAMRRSGKSPSGRIGCMRIEGPGNLLVT